MILYPDIHFLIIATHCVHRSIRPEVYTLDLDNQTESLLQSEFQIKEKQIKQEES